MAYDGSIRINTQLNTDSFQTGVKGMIGSFGKLAKTLGVGLSLAVFTKMGKEAIDLASDIAEVDNVVSKSFGSMRGEMDELAKNAIKNLGMSRLTAYQTGSTFMSMGRSMLDNAEDAKVMALELTKLTGNMSSFYNVSQDLASIALKSIYTGETETLKQYGVVMTEVNLKQFALQQGIKKAYSEMTQSEKVMLRYKYVTEQLSFIGDDFVDTQDSWANQTRILKEQWKEFLSIVGSGLITVLTPVVKVLNQIIGALINVGNTIAQVLSKIFGVQMQSISAGASDASDAYGDLADSADAYGDSAKKAGKKAQGALASFDSLETIASKSGNGSSGGAGGLGELKFETEDLEAKEMESEDIFDKLKDKFQGVIDFLKDLFDNFLAGWTKGFNLLGIAQQIAHIQDYLDSIKNSLIDIWTDPKVVGAMKHYFERFAYNLGLILASVVSIALTIAENLLGGLARYLEENKDRIKQHLINMFDIHAEIMDLLGQLFFDIAYIFKAFASDNGIELTSNLIGIFADAIMGITEILSKFGRDVLNIIVTPLTENKEHIRAVLEDVLGVFADISESIKNTIDNTFDKMNEVYDEHFKPFFDSIADGFTKLGETFLNAYDTYLAPALDNFTKKFDELWNVVQPYVNDFLDMLGVLMDLLTVLWEEILVPFGEFLITEMMEYFANIVDFVSNEIIPIIESVAKIFDDVIIMIKDVLQGLIKFLTGAFTGDWKKAWEGISDIVKAVWEGIKTIIKDAINVIITLANRMIEKIIDNLLNTVLEKINEFMSALPFGLGEGFQLPHISAPQIPLLAKGAVIEGGSPFLAVLGDQPQGQTNIETPLDTMVQAFRTALNDMNVGGSREIIMNVDGETFARLTLDDFLSEANRQGYDLAIE